MPAGVVHQPLEVLHRSQRKKRAHVRVHVLAVALVAKSCNSQPWKVYRLTMRTHLTSTRTGSMNDFQPCVRCLLVSHSAMLASYRSPLIYGRTTARRRRRRSVLSRNEEHGRT